MSSFDTLIRGAMVYDGLGGQPQQTDVAITGARIAAIGSLDAYRGREEVAASGRALSPGFIDVHTHDDFAAIVHPDMAFKSRGGVTTCIVGNCGFGAAPYEPAIKMLDSLMPGHRIPRYSGHEGYAALVESICPGVNIGVLAGHGTLRLGAMGSADRPPTDTEMAHMKTSLHEALAAGVFGLSTGLIYEPGKFAATEELVELAAEMRGTDGIYATHMRDEGAGLLRSVTEAIDIGLRAGVPVQISHHKASGRDNWGLVEDSLKLIEAAQARGQNIHADQYPYTAGSTSLQAVLDNGAFLDDAAAGGIGSLSASDVIVASAPGHPEWEGLTIEALAANLMLDPRATGAEICRAAPGATAVLHMMSEEDVRMVMRHPSTMIGSDGIPTLDGKPHPRLYNSFARVLGHYSRGIGLFDLSTAIYRMTGFAAQKFGLTDRGQVTEGAFADLVLFDADAIIDNGTFEQPNQYPSGISRVWVNGQTVISEGQVTNARPGCVLRRQN